MWIERQKEAMMLQTLFVKFAVILLFVIKVIVTKLELTNEIDKKPELISLSS